MVACYVVGCKSGNNGSKWHKFKIPRKATEETRQTWIKNIPKQRDKPWNFNTCFLCHLHFESKYVVKVNQVIFNGEVMAEEERKHWTLTNDAVPTIFANEKLSTNYDVPSRSRKPPALRKPLQPLNHNVIPKNNNETTNSEEVEVCHEPHLAKTFLESFRQFTLPDGWLVRKFNDRIIYQKVVECAGSDSSICKIDKSVEVNSMLEVRFQIRGKDVQPEKVLCSSPLENMEGILLMFDETAVCTGIKNFNGIKECPVGTRYGSAWFSYNCPGVYKEGTCVSCTAMKSYLLKRGKYLCKPKVERKPKINPIKTFSNASRTIKRLTKRVQTMKDEMNALRLHVKRLNTGKLSQLIEKESSIPGPMKSALLAAAQLAKCKSSHGHRYAPDWLLQCLLIRITSPKAYRFLRNNQILALPHPNHLSKLLHGVPCRFGFSDFVFTELSKQYQGKHQQDRQFILSFDEIKVRESLHFDKFAGHFIGYIDYAEFTSEYKISAKDKSPEADHALVLMIRNMNSNMIQPIASFASRGAAPGHILAKIMMSAVMKLEEVNCEVLGIVCDGAQSNKKMWKILGIRGSSRNIISSITNPSDSSRQIHFLSDVPHMMKCVRNHLQKHEIGKFQGELVNWGFYRAVFDFDKKEDLKLAPKLTQQHLTPGPFQKMVVSYATQIVSKTVADAIKLQRESFQRREFVGSEGTEKFTRKLNEIFDILNAKLPHEGIKLDSNEFRALEEFLGDLCDDNTVFASDKTMESLRVTVHASLSIIRYLCQDLNFAYVLTAKCNQDCLERFFGLLRSFGGDDSHPSIISFGHLFRILSFYNPVKLQLKGNVRFDEDTELSLDPFIDELKSLRKAAMAKRKEVRGRHESQLQSKFSVMDQSESNFSEFDQEGCVVFYLCGYVAKKSKSFTTCLKCQESLRSDCSTLPVKAWTDIKSLGGLTYPSDFLYKVIKESVEPVVTSHLHSGNITDEFFLDQIIADLPQLDMTGIGCSEDHSNNLMVEVVLFYINMRCFFYRRSHNWEVLNGGVERKRKMKEAKLT